MQYVKSAKDESYGPVSATYRDLKIVPVCIKKYTLIAYDIRNFDNSLCVVYFIILGSTYDALSELCQLISLFLVSSSYYLWETEESA